MRDRIQQKPADFSHERRRLFGLVRGAAAAGLVFAHSGVLKALEGLKGLRWKDGLRKMRDSARKDVVEHLGVFTGSRELGKWTTTLEGHFSHVDASGPEIAQLALRESSREEIRKGIAIDHTHPDSTSRELFKQLPGMSRVEPKKEALDFISLPSPGDAQVASINSASLYLKMAGVQHPSVENGVISGKERWILKKAVWDATLKKKYPVAASLCETQELVFRDVFPKLMKVLLIEPDVVQTMFKDDLEQWKDVAKTPRQRAEVLAKAIMHNEIHLRESDWTALNKWSASIEEDLVRFGVLNQIESVGMARERIALELQAGTITLEKAIDEYTAELMKMGVAMTREEIQ